MFSDNGGSGDHNFVWGPGSNTGPGARNWRVFILPFDRLTYVHFCRPVADEQLIKMFGALMVLERKAPTATEDEMTAAATGGESEPVAETPEDPHAAAEVAQKSAINLRDRLRTRLAQIAHPKTGAR